MNFSHYLAHSTPIFHFVEDMIKLQILKFVYFFYNNRLSTQRITFSNRICQQVFLVRSNHLLSIPKTNIFAGI